VRDFEVTTVKYCVAAAGILATTTTATERVYIAPRFSVCKSRILHSQRHNLALAMPHEIQRELENEYNVALS
jgi:hypothetical protein